MKHLLSLFVLICDSATSLQSDQVRVSIATLNTQHVAMKWTVLLLRNKGVQYSDFSLEPAVITEVL